MRLPWPFGRRTPSDGPSSDAPGGPAHEDAPASAATRDAGAPPTGAWATLPPIQRTVSAAPLVAPSAPFLDAVPGHRPLPPIVQPLGHEATPSAPAGLVAAHAAPIPSLTSHAAMPTRHVQRRASADPGAGAWSEPDAPGSPASSASPSPAGSEAEPELAPVRQVAAVAPARTVTPPARPLTVAPPIATATRAPVAQRSAAADAAPSVAEPALPLAARGTPPVRSGSRWSEGPAAPSRPGLGAPIAPSPAPAAPAPPAPAPASRSATTPVPPQRAGLGAPMAALPSTAVQRSASGAPLPLPPRLSAAQLAQAAAGGQAALPVPAPAAPGASLAGAGHDHDHPQATAGDRPSTAMDAGPAAPHRGLPVLPVARRRADGAAEPVRDTVQRSQAPGAPARTGGPATTTGAPASPATSDRTASPATVVLPLVGARPLRPAVAIQRSADGSTGTDPGEPDLPVPARWESGAALPDTIGSPSLPAARSDGSVPLQRLASASDAPATPDRAPGTREILFAAPGWSPASLAASADAGGATLPAIQRLPGAPAAAARPAARRPVATSADVPTLQLARPPAPAPIVMPPAPAPAPAAPAGRIEAPASSPTPTVQTSPAGSSPALPTFTATPVVQRVAGTAPAPDSGPAGHTDRELDELARALSSRIRGQLRAEVISEREARGLSFDAF